MVLRSPVAPSRLGWLLPAHCAGQAAPQLCINIYQRLPTGALAFDSDNGETSVGELPAPDTLYFQRFGGLNIA